MTREEITEKILELIIKACKHKIKKDKIHESSKLDPDLGLNSMDRVELAANILEAFSIPDAPIEEMVEFITVGQVVDFIEQQLRR